MLGQESPVLTAAQCRMVCRQGQGQVGPAESAKGSTVYSLHAVVCHTGNLLGGHYIGYVRYVTSVCC